MNLNKVFLIGRLTDHPDLRTTPNGQSVASFSLATNRVWNDKNRERKEDTEFHSIVVWGRQAEIANQFLQKGSLALIEGRLQTRSWTDKDGNKRKTTEIVAERIQFGPRGKEATTNMEAGQKMEKNEPKTEAHEELPTIDLNAEEEINSEDLPF